MAKYIHYYRCGCVNWASNVWVKENSESSVPQFHQQQHFQLNKDARCLRYLRFAYTEQIEQGNRKQLPIDDPGTGVLLVARDAKVKKGPTIAVMWDKEKSKWYHGSCGHKIKRAETNVPANIADYVESLKVDPSDWAFGWNCAEVHCVIRAYEDGKTAADLKDCYFVAYSVARPAGLYGACRTCKDWITKFNAKYLRPNK